MILIILLSALIIALIYICIKVCIYCYVPINNMNENIQYINDTEHCLLYDLQYLNDDE